MRFAICNVAASCAQGQDFGAKNLSMTNNASYDLTLLQINRLVVVHLKESPCVQNPLARPPKFCLFFQAI
jgi:hypothetical protein